MATPPKNCWDFWNCPKEARKNCPAYLTGSGKDCWTVIDPVVKKECPKLKNEFGACWKCNWFKKVNPDFEKKSA